MSFIRWGIRTGLIIGRAPGNKGNYGEMIVASIFDQRFFGKEEHYIINNIIFETSKDVTHQIDHIVIYKTGVFVIETKHLRGIIKGREEDGQWAQIIGKKIYNIYNPVLQNRTHVKIVNAFLEDKYDVHSVVVFTKSNKPLESPSYVLDLEDLKDYVKNYKIDRELTSEEMKEIFNLLSEYKKNCVISKKEHISNLNRE